MASSRSSGRSPSRPSFGSEVPRVFTPPLRKLTPKTTLGFALIEFARDVLGMELLPWQKWLAIQALEILPDGSPRFRTVLLLVARQNGKSTFLQVLALFFLYVRGASLVIGTAQNLDIAEEVWQGAVDIAQDVPDLAAEIERVTMVNGKKALELRQGERYKVQAANRRGGRGLSGDLVMLDELREHQNWDAWGAVTKTTMARPLAQVWAASNAGDSTSVVLSYLRQLAHLAIGDPDGLSEGIGGEPDVEVDDDSLGIFEWSAAPGCAINDPQGIADANPSKGHTITERAITSAMRTDPEAVFRTEVLCQWVRSMTHQPIPPDLWALQVDTGTPLGADAVFGLDVDIHRRADIAAVWRRADGGVQVAVVEHDVDAFKAAEKCRALTQKWDSRVLVPRAFGEEFATAGLAVDVVKPAELNAASGTFVDQVLAGTLWHDNDDALNEAIEAARWAGGRGQDRSFDLRQGPQIRPLLAAVRALHGLSSTGPSAYEDHDLLVV